METQKRDIFMKFRKMKFVVPTKTSIAFLPSWQERRGEEDVIRCKEYSYMCDWTGARLLFWRSHSSIFRTFFVKSYNLIQWVNENKVCFRWFMDRLSPVGNIRWPWINLQIYNVVKRTIQTSYLPRISDSKFLLQK